MSVAECNLDREDYRFFYGDMGKWYEVDYSRFFAENGDLCDEYPSDNFVKRRKDNLSQKDQGEMEQEKWNETMRNLSIIVKGEPPTKADFQVVIDHYQQLLRKEEKTIATLIEALSKSDEELTLIGKNPQGQRSAYAKFLENAMKKKGIIETLITNYTTATQVLTIKDGNIEETNFEKAEKKISEYYSTKQSLQEPTTPVVNPNSLDFALAHDLVTPLPENIYSDLLISWWMDNLDQGMGEELQEIKDNNLETLRKKIEITEKYLGKLKGILNRFQ